jgi:tetratricopeptide (TPR) repeat protein
VPGAAAPPADPGAAFEAANARYLGGDFEGAAQAYEALAEAGWEASALALNLGNARARLGQRGRAIAAWERAVRLDHRNADARANLDAARAANVDRFGGPEPSLVERLVDRVPDPGATAAFAVLWACLWAALAARRMSRRARSALGVAAVSAAFLAVPAGALVALKAVAARTPAAVVVVPATPLRPGPSLTLRPVLEVHEGTRLRLLEARGELVRVRLENGLEGWAGGADLERI